MEQRDTLHGVKESLTAENASLKGFVERFCDATGNAEEVARVAEEARTYISSLESSA